MEALTITENRNIKNKTFEINSHLHSYISSVLTANVSNANNLKPRTELDSHVNMAVLGNRCFVFDHTGKSFNVSAFNPSLESTKLPIVDAVIVYDCPYSLHSYLLLIRNALYLKEANDNLIPPFLLREAGLRVNDCAKQHAHPHATNDHHSIFFPDEELRIHLKLNGIFSYFHHRAPHLEEIDNLKVLFLTPDSASWDPHSTHFEERESSLIDHNGDVISTPPNHLLFSSLMRILLTMQ